MPKKSVLGHPDNVPNLAREGFSLDQVFTFTASTGMLLPVWQDFLNPGETLHGAPNFLLRSDAFLSPAMADIDCFCELFFVPMQKILSCFGEWLYQIDDIRTDYVDLEKFSEYLPILKSQTSSNNPFAGFTKSCFEQPLYPDTTPGAYNSYYRFDTFGFGLYRLMFHFGFNPQSIFYGIYNSYAMQDEETNQAILDIYQDYCYDLSEANFCPYMFAAYQGIYYDIYRNSEFEHNNILAYNMDSIFNDGYGYLDADSIFGGSSSSQGRRAMFDLRYRWRGKDYFTATRSTPLINSVSMMPMATKYLKQVNQWLTTGSYQMLDRNNSFSYIHDLGYNALTNFGVDLKSGNIDVELQGSADIDLTGMSVDYDREFEFVSSGYSLSPDNAKFLSYDSGKIGLEASTGGSEYHAVHHRHGLSGEAYADFSDLSPQVADGLSSVLTTARLRTMFALEKLSRITQRAGKHYDDQTLAHFGFKVNKGLSGEVYKIGSWHTTVGIQKVTSTAATDDAPLGEQAGVGYAVLDGSKKKFKFTAPCHGIVMCIWSCAPRYKYIFTRDKLNYKTKLWDFFKPSLDNLGSQPLFSYEFPGQSTTLQTGVAGWQWRFMESKVKFNRVSPVFATVSKNPWSITSLPYTYQDCGFVSPMDLNLLINTQYNTQPAWPESGQQQDHKTWFGDFPREFLRDPFTIDFYMDCTKVSTMSTFGDTPLNGI